jgi:hypothetical protein
MEFIDKQRLKLWWLYILLGIETIIVLSIILFDKGGMSFQDLKNIYFLPIVAILVPYLLVYLICKNSLTLKIDQCGINYHYWPFARKKNISWTKIDKIYIRRFDALGEYGGWGLKHRLWFNPDSYRGNDKAYILNDKNLGLQILLHNNKKILFSSSKIDELSLFLINLKHQYHIGAIETDVRER